MARFANITVNQYKLGFQSKIAPLLVEIRGRGKEESELAKILETDAGSPINKQYLGNWLREKRAESAVLKSFVLLLDREVTFSNNIGEYLQHILTNDKVISLSIYFPDSPDTILDNIDASLDVSELPTSLESWFRQHLTLHQIQRSLEDFFTVQVLLIP